MTPEQHKVIECVLRDLPIRDKLIHLVFALLCDDAAMSVENLIEVSLVMSRRLPPLQRAAAIFQMREACAELEATWQ